MAKMTKSKCLELLGYLMILEHNRERLFTEQQVEQLVNLMKAKFKGDEDKALQYVKDKATKLLKDLEETVGG